MPKKPEALVYVDKFIGLRTDVDADKVPEGYLVKAENLRLVSGGGFYTRPGVQTLWNLGTGKKIDQMEVMNEFNCLFMHSNTKVYVAKDKSSTPFDIGLTLTAGYPSTMVEYNGFMYISDGKDDFTFVPVTTFAVQATNSDTRIQLAAGYAGNFINGSGTVISKGYSISYTKALGPTVQGQAFTADNTTDTITANGHLLLNGDTVTLVNSGGALPAGLAVNTTYYIVNKAANTFQLAATLGGSVIDITDNGTGTNRVVSTVDYLAGCTVPAGGSPYASGEIIVQINGSTTLPKGTVLESAFEKLMAAGVTGKAHFVQYSVSANAQDFSSAGSGTQIYGKYGKVTAMKTLLTNLYIAKDKGIAAWTGFASDGTPNIEDLSEAYGVVNANCFKRMGDMLVMFTTIRNFKTIEPATVGFNPQPVINPHFDDIIVGTLRNLDSNQSGASMGYGTLDRMLRGTVFNGSVRQTMIFNTLCNGWSVDIGYVPNCWVEWNGQVYMGSALDDTVYQAETGLLDGPADTGVPPRMDVLTPIHYVSDRRSKVTIGQVYVTGMITRQTKGTIVVYCDGVAQRTFTLDGSAPYVSKSDARPFGFDYYGHDFFGHPANEESGNGFAFGVGIDVNVAAKSVQIEFICQGTGYRLQISSYEILPGIDQVGGLTAEDIY